MHNYKNLSGNSGVSAYEIGKDYILVQFIGGEIYRYTYASAGQRSIEHMKQLALTGEGLSTFISQKVKDQYEK